MASGIQTQGRSRAGAGWAGRATALVLGVLLAGCAAPSTREAFTATGEIIAMGGGEAGVAGACFSCHGLRGEGNGQTAPRLAGLPAGYLQKQLEDYAAGLRPDPAMRFIAGALDADSRRRVAAYYAGLTPRTVRIVQGQAAPDAMAEALYHRGDAARGLAACAACHGALGEGVGPGAPPLAGQPVAYLHQQLAQWRRGQRRNDPRGVMVAISARLTTREAEALARYAAGLGSRIAQHGAPPATSR